MGFLIEFLGEFILEVYLELMMLIVPEKNLTKRQIFIAKLIAVFVILLVIFLLIFGCVLIFENNNLLGIIPFSLSIIISIVQIVFGIILAFIVYSKPKK